MLLDREDVAKAVRMQERSYQLLLWCGRMVGRGVVDASRMHVEMSDAEAAIDWVRRMRLSLPNGSRPMEEEVEAFGRFFCTYLKTSFTLDVNPRLETVSRCGCWCRWCTLVREASRLRVRTVAKRDKKRADRLIDDVLNTLAMRAEVPLFASDFDPLLAEEAFRADAALVTYGYWLVKRTGGFSDGPALLSLWREVSYRDGRPNRKFILDADAIMHSESRLKDRLLRAA